MAHRALRHGQALIHSFLALRKAVGFIGMVLPFVLLLVHGSSLGSVSEGYYTAGAALFVAGVCAIGMFLLFYRGYDQEDRIASFVAGVAALLVGQVPCGCGPKRELALLWGWGSGYDLSVWPRIHFLAATVLFCTLAYFCLRLFPRSDCPAGQKNPKKQQRNYVYYACGGVMVACLLALFVHVWRPWLGPQGVFIAETIMMLAFGLSWAVKGEAIGLLNDRAPASPPLAPTPA